jgi:hypothetical protein
VPAIGPTRVAEREVDPIQGVPKSRGMDLGLVGRLSTWIAFRQSGRGRSAQDKVPPKCGTVGPQPGRRGQL